MANPNEEQLTNAASNTNAGPSLIIESSIADVLPFMVKDALSKMSEGKQSQFVDEYKRKKKSTALAYFFLILCFGCPYGYLGRWGIQIGYWISLFVFVGFLWFIYLLFALPGIVKDANGEIATQIVRDMKVMS